MTALFAAYPLHIRRVIVLGAIAAALTLIAILGVIVARTPAKNALSPSLYFADLGAHAADVRRIHIQDKDKAAELTYAPETGWVVSDKDGYRARFDKIQQLIRALSELERFEKKTADAKWHKRLLLTDPRSKGEATLVQLYGASDKPMDEILIGSNADVDAASGKAQIYVRAPGNDQVWLARAANLVPVSADGGDWLNPSIIDVPKKRIARADVAPNGAPAYAVVRASADADNFTLDTMPAGMKLKAETSANGIGAVLSELALRDVAGADRITFSPAATAATYQTFNGLKIRVETAKLGNDTWVRLIPSMTDRADDQAKAEAADLARRLSPWVFQIESWKASQLDTKLESLIEPVSGSAKSSTPAHTGNAAPKSSTKPESSLAPPKPSHATDKKTPAHSTNAAPKAKAPSDAMKPAKGGK